jgi:DHA2 family multidrug resistance protein-like MFS transporter
VAKAGSAAAVSETSNEFGFALGIAVLGSIGTAIYRHVVTIPAGVPADAATATRDSLTKASAAATNLPREAAAGLLAAARDAFTIGLHAIAAISAAILAGVAVLVLTQLRQVRPSGDTSTDDLPAAGAEPPGDPDDASVLGPV